MTTEEREELQFMLGTVRDLRSARARADLGLLVVQGKRDAWRLKTAGVRRSRDELSRVSQPNGSA